MKITATIAAAVLAFCASTVTADQCGRGSELSGGNYYCQEVKSLQYSNVGHSGSYNEVTQMTGGACQSKPHPYSGSLAPLDEEVSLHFRGPMHLKKVAAYTKSGGGAKKREIYGGPHARRHAGHQKFHENKNEKRADWVTATIDGQVVSWENNWFGEPTAAAAPAAAPAAETPAVANAGVAKAAAPKINAEVKTASKAVDPNAAYTRVGFYDAASGVADGLTFLGNHGGQGSGVFDNNYGMSLAYLNADGNGGSGSPTVLKDTFIASNNEFAIFTDRECQNGDCGYTRPGTVAYHGFDGADKIFMFEFDMPHDGNNGFNGDMPAIWMLNANIPRTLQYGEATCSCWDTGCGEFDIIEVLSPGEERCKSTLHTNAPGGSSDWIRRPTNGLMKVAVIMNSADGTINVQVLPDGQDFPGSLSAGEVNNMLTLHGGNDVSQFSIA